MNQLITADGADVHAVGSSTEQPGHTSALSTIAVSGTTLALAACGGGGSENSAAIPNPAPKDPPLKPDTPELASRFLLQADFSANDASIARVMQIGYTAWLDEQMAMPRSQSHCDWLIEKGNYITAYDASYPKSWMMSVTRKFMSSPDGVRQRMVLLWSELFVVSHIGLSGVKWINFAIANYLDMFERMGFGNFRDLLEAVTLSSAMGSYLNMKGNRKANPKTGTVPDENYAREVMQLFTIGLYQLNPDGTYQLDSQGQPIETYTTEDVQGLAAVFTGWSLATVTAEQSGVLPTAAYAHSLPMQLNEGYHSDTEKKFLGVTIPAKTGGVDSLKIALDTLFHHANTGPFIAKYLIQRLVTSNPSPDYVRRVAAVFADNGQGVRGDMASVYKAVLLDTEARTPSASVTFGKLREPVVRLMQWARTFNAVSSDGSWSFYNYTGDTALVQYPMFSPSVFNFFRPGYVPPNTEIDKAGLVAPEFQILAEPTVVSYVNFIANVITNRHYKLVNYSDEQTVANDAAALVDRYNLLLAAGQLSPNTLQTIKDAVQSIEIPSTDPSSALLNRVHATIVLVMSCPEYLIQK